jgi:hypothetical protein
MRGWVGYRDGLDVSEKRKISLTAGNGTTILRTASRFISTIPTELFWLPSTIKLRWIVSSQEDDGEACKKTNKYEG